jgi:hypothetical protein
LTSSYAVLISRILGELSELHQIVEKVSRVWSQAEEASQDDVSIYLDSVALNLHGFYTGIEGIFESIAHQVDATIPQTVTWHRDLLIQMSKEMPGGRPAVISDEVATKLDEFRRFRHLVRNLYTFDLDDQKIEPLVELLPEIWPLLRAELAAFASFLEEIENSTPGN